jgi:hypothetical protein
MARLYANENLLEPVVSELRRLGHDVKTMRESGNCPTAGGMQRLDTRLTHIDGRVTRLEVARSKRR